MQAILHDRLAISEIVIATFIPVEATTQGYEASDDGAAHKFVLNPRGLLVA